MTRSLSSLSFLATAALFWWFAEPYLTIDLIGR